MAVKRSLILIPIAAFGICLANLLTLPGRAVPNSAGGKGAQVYCYMRANGNNHEVSWNAAYEIIKRQKSSLFKTSPKHGAVMIIENVVQNPNDYENCGDYLGDLFGPLEGTLVEEGTISEDSEIDENQKKGDRYIY